MGERAGVRGRHPEGREGTWRRNRVRAMPLRRPPRACRSRCVWSAQAASNAPPASALSQLKDGKPNTWCTSTRRRPHQHAQRPKRKTPSPLRCALGWAHEQTAIRASGKAGRSRGARTFWQSRQPSPPWCRMSLETSGSRSCGAGRRRGEEGGREEGPAPGVSERDSGGEE